MYLLRVGGPVSGGPLIKGGSQIPISPPPADPDNQRPGLSGRDPVLINMGTGCSGVGGPNMDCGGTPRPFFRRRGVSLQPIPDLRAWYAPGGEPMSVFYLKIGVEFSLTGMHTKC